jgi:hypothetical protein
MTDVTIDFGTESPVWVPVAIPVGAGTVKAATGRLLLGGWSVLNPGAAAERVDFFDGIDATGLRVGGAIVPLSDSRAHTYPTPGLYVQQGLAVVLTGADLVVSVFVAYLS